MNFYRNWVNFPWSRLYDTHLTNFNKLRKCVPQYPCFSGIVAYTLKIQARSKPMDLVMQTRASGGAQPSCFHCITTYRLLYFVCGLIVNNNNNNDFYHWSSETLRQIQQDFKMLHLPPQAWLTQDQRKLRLLQSIVRFVLYPKRIKYILEWNLDNPSV